MTDPKHEPLSCIHTGLRKAMEAAHEAFVATLAEDFFQAIATIEREAEERGRREGFKRGLQRRARLGEQQQPHDWRADARRNLDGRKRP